MNQFTLFKTRRFLPLFITQFLGAFNDNIFKNAFVILITYRLAEIAGWNGQILITFAAAIFILPFFLFSAFAGQLADKYEKSRLIAIIKFIEIILMIVAVIGFYRQSIFLLMCVLFALGAHSTFFGPLKYAILPDHLHENELIAGNGLIDAGTFLAILLGTILGGLLILEVKGELLISIAVIIVAIGGWCSSRFIPKTMNYHPDLQLRYNFIKETWVLMQYAKMRRDIFLSILGISWFWLIGATFLAEFPVFAKDVLGANQDVVTFFLSLFSIGIAIGSLLCNRLLKGKVNVAYVPFSLLGISLFTVDLYLAASQGIVSTPHGGAELIGLAQFLQSFNGWRITIDLLLIAICGGLYTVPLYALLQKRSEKTHRARVIASNNVMNAFFMVVAAMITVMMLKVGFSVNTVFLTVAIGNGIIAARVYTPRI
jgi:acyl-[acyl-carrier-protein]-phospholipid O-acyltransferase/long-chain-fatty-acid--[acyl-carrier-protein] ligase